MEFKELCAKMMDGNCEEDRVIMVSGEVITHMELCMVIGCSVMQSIAENNLLLDEETKANIHQMMKDDYGIEVEF